jgi:hypothetical protein
VEFRAGNATEALRLLQGATHKLQRAGLALPDAATQPTPRQLAAALAQAQAQTQTPSTTPIGDWLLVLEAWRYAPHSPPLDTLQAQYRQLPWPERDSLKTPAT